MAVSQTHFINLQSRTAHVHTQLNGKKSIFEKILRGCTLHSNLTLHAAYVQVNPCIVIQGFLRVARKADLHTSLKNDRITGASRLLAASYQPIKFCVLLQVVKRITRFDSSNRTLDDFPRFLYVHVSEDSPITKYILRRHTNTLKSTSLQQHFDTSITYKWNAEAQCVAVDLWQDGACRLSLSHSWLHRPHVQSLCVWILPSFLTLRVWSSFLLLTDVVQNVSIVLLPFSSEFLWIARRDLRILIRRVRGRLFSLRLEDFLPCCRGHQLFSLRLNDILHNIQIAYQQRRF